MTTIRLKMVVSGVESSNSQKKNYSKQWGLNLKMNQTSTAKQLIGSMSLLVVMLLEIFLQWMSITTRNVILASRTHNILENLSLKNKRLKTSLSIASFETLNRG